MPLEPDFGVTLSFPDQDLDPLFGMKSGRAALTQAIHHRLITPRGKLRGHPSYGYDIRSMLGAGAPNAGSIAFRIQQEVAAECQKDERVQRAVVKADYVIATGVLTLTIRLLTAQGPFRLTLRADAVTVSVLDDAAAA